MLSIEQAIAAVRTAMRSEGPGSFAAKYDITEARLVESRGEVRWAVVVAIPGDELDSPFSVANVDVNTGAVEWLHEIS